MKIWEFEKIIKNLDDDMEISVQVETEDYDIRHQIHQILCEEPINDFDIEFEE